MLVGPRIPVVEVDRLTRIWDVAPTLAELLGIAAPADWIGSRVIEAFGSSGPAPGGDVVATDVSAYTWMYDDSGTGADVDLSVWRPQWSDGQVWLGDVAHASHSAPGFGSVVLEDDSAKLRAPVGWELIWRDTGSGGSHDLSLWMPIPSLGFTCLGSVATAGYGAPPDVPDFRCVHDSFLVPATSSWTWDDAGSGADWDGAVYTCGGSTGVEPGTFVTRRVHGDPGHDLCRALDPARVQ